MGYEISPAPNLSTSPCSLPPFPLDLNSNSEFDFEVLSLTPFQLFSLAMALWITSYYYYHPSLCAHLCLNSNLIILCTYMALIVLLGCPWFCCVFCFEYHSF